MNKKVTASLDELIPLIEESFQSNQSISFKVKGTSMGPFFKDNETEVKLKSYGGKLIKRNIYLFKVNDKYLLHRYLKETAGKLYFRGDALYQYEIVEKEDILGEVVSFSYKQKETMTSSCCYRMKVSTYLCIKSLKLIVRRMIKGR